MFTKKRTRRKKKLAAITALLAATIMLSASPQTITAQTTPMQTGLNYLSNGNGWMEPEALLRWDFSRFQKDQIQHLSIRIMWSVMMPTPDRISPVALENIKKVLNTAEAYGLKVNLSFWTQFGFTLGFPAWAGSDYYSLLTEPTKTLYLNYLAQIVNELRTFPAVDSWAILNEPHYSEPKQKSLFQTLMADCVQAIKKVDDSRPVVCRFALAFTPATGKYDSSIYSLFDAFTVTVYLNASNPKDRIYDSRWADYEKTVADCKTLGLPLWVIEFGSRKSDTQAVAAMFEGNLAKFHADGVARVYAWAWQTEDAASEAFNLYGSKGNPKPAYYALLQRETSTIDTVNSAEPVIFALSPQNKPVNLKEEITVSTSNADSPTDTIKEKGTDIVPESQPSSASVQLEPATPSNLTSAVDYKDLNVLWIGVVLLCIFQVLKKKHK